VKQSIFIIEDDTHTLNYLELLLRKEGFYVYKYDKGDDALNDIERFKPDLIILDIMLPDINGLKICKKIKDNPETEDIPVIMLTVKSDDQDVIIGFSFGCTDYITKPFNEKILIARIKAALTKIKSCKNCTYCVKESKNHIIQIDKLFIDPSSFEVVIKNKLVNLTPLEFKLLYFLAKNQNKVYTRNQLFAELYESNDHRSDRAIDILVNRIRKKIGTYAENLESIYGVGYSFKIPKQ
jgi:DNA-binding response OmpR family regulator